MASSNRHWPSMFKSKPCHPHQHQWQHDINPHAASSRSVPFSSVGGCEERSPEPKPRWNPKPEQIRILETVFNSGIVNPPRDEIRRIRSQLQEYGPVGDANVFYWFQNRKSRSKHKQRHFQTTTKSQRTDSLSPPSATATGITTTLATTPPSSSSSSSDKSSQKLVDKAFSVNVLDALNSPTASVNQPYFRTAAPGEFLPEPFFFPMYRPPTAGLTNGGAVFTQGFCFPELSANVVHGVPHDQTVGNCSGLLLTDLMMNYGSKNKKKVEDHEKVLPISAHTILPPVTLSVPSTMNHIQGEGQGKSTVFINDVVFEVAEGPFNVREAFGDDAVLIHSSGQPVVTNEWGVTLQSLQHGAFYYLVRMA